MQAEIFSPHILISESLKAHIVTNLKRLDLHYGDHIHDVKVRILDVNGPRGGVDKVCRLQIHFNDHHSINTEGRHTDLYSAVNMAAYRMERSIESALDASRDRNPNARRSARSKRSSEDFDRESQSMGTNDGPPMLGATPALSHGMECTLGVDPN